VITLQYAYALDRAAELEAALGHPDEAARNRQRAAAVRTAVRQKAWDADKGLFRDAPGESLFSQQTNIMAVLTDAVPADERRAVMERILSDTTLTQATYYFGFYLFEALAKAGLAEQYVERLEPWKQMLAMGLTTTPERPEPTRSDSHAWSAHPNYGLLATVLGVRPDGPGWRAVRIAPALGALRRASGRIPHPRGDIDVTLSRSRKGGLHAEITLPRGVAGRFVWQGKEVALREGRQELDR
jgi:hypothetical protein